MSIEHTTVENEEIIDLLEQVPLFAHLRGLELNRLAGLFHVVIFRQAETIFGIGDPSDAMFILVDGQVDLVAETARKFASLKRGDMFGEEALLFDDPRLYQAVAHTETVLLQLNADHYLFICDEFPGVEDRLEVAIHSRNFSIQVELPWLQGDEYVHVMTRRHPAILWKKLLLPGVFSLIVLLLSMLIQWQWLPERIYGLIFLVFGLVIGTSWIVWKIIDWRNDYYIVTNKRVVWIEKIALIYESRQEAPLRTIMSIGIQRSRIGSVFNFADVVVMTYVGTIRFGDLAQAETVASLIESYWHRSETINRREEAQVMAQKLDEKLGLPIIREEDGNARESSRSDQTSTSKSKEPAFFAWLFADFIRLRYETGGAIVYRKHWFVLIERIWIPIVLMAITLMGMTGRLSGRLSFLPLTSTLVSGLLFVFGCFIWAIYQYADWHNDIFKVTIDQIVDIDQKPLGKVRRRSAPLENILSIEYERLGFWGFVFNFGTVYITVGNMRLSFDHVYNPSEVQQDIFYRMGERLESVRQFKIESERDRISEWIASYHRKAEVLRKGSGQHPPDE